VSFALAADARPRLAPKVRLRWDRKDARYMLLYPERGLVLNATAAGASPSWQRMVTEVVAMEAADKARALGDTMPVGLQLG
jgi:hypothetical protein